MGRATTYLGAGDKAGSNLTKAQEPGVRVLVETQFRAMLEDKPL